MSLVKADKGYCGVDSGLDGCVVECEKSNFGTAEFRPVSGSWAVECTGAPSLPQELNKITQRLTALPLTFIVEPALNYGILAADIWRDTEIVLSLHGILSETFSIID